VERGETIAKVIETGITITQLVAAAEGNRRGETRDST
jgi:hypothetical protein